MKLVTNIFNYKIKNVDLKVNSIINKVIKIYHHKQHYQHHIKMM